MVMTNGYSLVIYMTLVQPYNEITHPIIEKCRMCGSTELYFVFNVTACMGCGNAYIGNQTINDQNQCSNPQGIN